MQQISQRRARWTVGTAVAALVLAGSVAVAGAATPWWWPQPSTTTTTTTTAPAAPPSAGASIGCAAGDVANTIYASGPTYLDPSSPTVNFSTTSSSRVSWTVVSPARQRRVVAFYTSAGFVTYSGVGPSSVPKTGTSSQGTLSTLTVCTSPLPAASSSTSTTAATTTTTAATTTTTSATTTTTLRQGSCPAGQVENTATYAGGGFIDASSPTLTFLFSSRSVSWIRSRPVTQTGGTATYALTQTTISAGASSVPTSTSAGGQLFVVRVCTTA